MTTEACIEYVEAWAENDGHRHSDAFAGDGMNSFLTWGKHIVIRAFMEQGIIRFCVYGSYDFVASVKIVLSEIGTAASPEEKYTHPDAFRRWLSNEPEELPQTN